MLYLVWNGAMQTTAAPVAVTTGTAIKTMLQVKTVTPAHIVDWWISFDGSAAATPIKVELIETDVAATVTASVNADITQLDAEALKLGDPTTLYIAVGTTSTGYTATSEGSTTATRNLAVPQFVAPTNGELIQLPLGRAAYLQQGKFARIRVTAGAAVNCLCGMTVEF